jgi:hypothetical protein
MRRVAQIEEPPREGRPRLDQTDRGPGKAARGQPAALVERDLRQGAVEPGAGVPDAGLARAVEAARPPRDGEGLGDQLERAGDGVDGAVEGVEDRLGARPPD